MSRIYCGKFFCVMIIIVCLRRGATSAAVAVPGSKGSFNWLMMDDDDDRWTG